MPTTKALFADRLIDGTGRQPLNDAVVFVDGEQITAVGTRAEINVPPDAEQIELTGKTLLPGFIDGHSHATINPGLRGIIGSISGTAIVLSTSSDIGNFEVGMTLESCATSLAAPRASASQPRVTAIDVTKRVAGTRVGRIRMRCWLLLL